MLSKKITTKLVIILRLVAAGILFQTLFFKFSGASESKFIFSTIGVEPWGRWFSGFAELVASILLLVPATQFLGAGMALGVMLGALASHVLILGVVVQNDGGLLFGLALTISACCVAILFLRKDEIPYWINWGKNLIHSNKK